MRQRLIIIDSDTRVHEHLHEFLCTGRDTDNTALELDSTYHETQALERIQAASALGSPYAIAFVGGSMSSTSDGFDTIRRLWQVDPQLEVILCMTFSDRSWNQIKTRIGETDRLSILEKPLAICAVQQAVRNAWGKWRLARSREQHVAEYEQLIATRTIKLDETQALLIKEIAERTRIEEELRRAEKMHALGRLAAGLGHEINNPLSYVTFSAESAMVEIHTLVASDTRHSLEQHLDAILAGTSRIADIVHGIRLMTHPTVMTADAVDITQAVDTALDTMRPQLGDEIELVTAMAAKLHVWCKRAELEHVIENLLKNAIHALEDTDRPVRRICVSCRRSHDDRSAVIEIADTGCGIHPDDLPKVFDPFFTTKPVGMGTGLGLARCHAIITGFDGDIRVTSELHRGTVFTVILPLMPAKKDVASDARACASMPANTHVEHDDGEVKGRVLIIDDEPLIRRVVRHALKAHDVVEASDGRDALRRCQSEFFDVILCDIMMPDVSGPEFYKLLQAQVPGAEASIVFFTAGSTEQTVHDFLDEVPNECLEKPIQRRRLQQNVNDRVRKNYREGRARWR